VLVYFLKDKQGYTVRKMEEDKWIYSVVDGFQINRALSETALIEFHRKVSVQKLKSAT
jgi:hypothetical protein